MSTRHLRSSIGALTPRSTALASVSPDAEMPAFVPFQLTDEMYAKIIRDPEAHGYPTLPAGSVKAPKFGYCFVECRQMGLRRPKLVDGLDWVPSSTANASSRVLRDGQTELLRYYCARRTKSAAAKPLVKPYVLFQARARTHASLVQPRGRRQTCAPRVATRRYYSRHLPHAYLHAPVVSCRV